MKIEKYEISRAAPPFIIAELSGNHNGSLDRALEIVEAAAQAGAHALKLQTYTADSMTLDSGGSDFYIDNPDSPWSGFTLYQLYKNASTPWEWHEPLIRRCAELGLVCFSSPFDGEAVDFLETLDVPAYKIASFENVDLELVRRVAETGKPIIASTGMASISEIEDLLNTARSAGCADIVLLKCTSAYPAPPEESNVLTIPHMRQTFNCEIGLSDHTRGIGTALAAVAHGAVIVEKHLTLDRTQGGVDAAFSMEPAELRALVAESKAAWQSLGKVCYGVQRAEKASVTFRRSLYVTKPLTEGEVLSRENVRAIRPGHGLPPKFLPIVLGRRINRSVEAGTRLTWDLLI